MSHSCFRNDIHIITLLEHAYYVIMQYNVMRKCRAALDAIVKEQIDYHKKTFKPHDIRDMIDQHIEKQLEHAEFFNGNNLWP